MHSEIHLLKHDVGHVFAADQGTIKQKGLSNQKFVIYSKEQDKSQSSKDDDKPEIVVMKRNESDIMTDAKGTNGVEIINREGELFMKQLEPEDKGSKL